MKKLPNLSKRTFWDVEISEINFQESYESIITRVFDRGTLDEVFEVINFYGFDFVKQTMQSTNEYLPNRSILLARAIFNLNYTDFKCSEKRPFQLNY